MTVTLERFRPSESEQAQAHRRREVPLFEPCGPRRSSSPEPPTPGFPRSRRRRRRRDAPLGWASGGTRNPVRYQRTGLTQREVLVLELLTRSRGRRGPAVRRRRSRSGPRIGVRRLLGGGRLPPRRGPLGAPAPSWSWSFVQSLDLFLGGSPLLQPLAPRSAQSSRARTSSRNSSGQR